MFHLTEQERTELQSLEALSSMFRDETKFELGWVANGRGEPLEDEGSADFGETSIRVSGDSGHYLAELLVGASNFVRALIARHRQFLDDAESERSDA